MYPRSMESNKADSVASSLMLEPPTLDRKIVYGVQVATIFIIVIFCLVNLTLEVLPTENEKLWVGLLGTSIGYLLPNPNLKNRFRMG